MDDHPNKVHANPIPEILFQTTRETKRHFTSLESDIFESAPWHSIAMLHLFFPPVKSGWRHQVVKLRGMLCFFNIIIIINLYNTLRITENGSFLPCPLLLRSSELSA